MTRLDQFDYHLPEDLIAAMPAERREEARLLVLNRRTGELEHRRFFELPGLLVPGDVLVINDARVVPVRLKARRSTGGRVELLLVRPAAAAHSTEAPPWPEAAPETRSPAPRRWLALLRAGARLREGETLRLDGSRAQITLRERRGEGCWVVRFDEPGPDLKAIFKEGLMPLPPYIVRARRRRGDSAEMHTLDRDRYQTVFARRPGAVAAPTAGLHFTRELLDVLEQKGVLVRPLSLLVGPGTFRPVRAERIEEHSIEREFYHIPTETAVAVAAALGAGRRVISTGTTCCRALEHAARRGPWREQSGWTDLFIYPDFEFKVVGALITNFHLPRSTLLMLVSAFAGRERVLGAYEAAVEEGYRFYSYGDAMFIR